jgi:hypothetical protein
MKKRPKKKDQAALVASWAKAPIGTDVMVTLDSGEEKMTKTSSEPFMLGAHTACIMLDGISGAYSLERVRQVEP